MASFVDKNNIAVVTPALFHEQIAADALEVIKKTGSAIVGQKDTLLVSFSDSGSRWATEKVSSSGGFVLGFSPAANREESDRVYREKNLWIDAAVYTGAGDSGHLMSMLESADLLLLPVFHKALVTVIEEAMRRSVPVIICTEKKRGDMLEMLRKIIAPSLFDAASIIVEVDPGVALEGLEPLNKV